MKKYKVIKATKEQIRKRPGMYLGGQGSKGICNLIKMLVDTFLLLSYSDKYLLRIEIISKFEYVVEIESSTNIKQRIKTAEIEENYFLNLCEAFSKSFNISFKKNKSVLINFQLDKSIFKTDVDYLELLETIIQWTYLKRNVETLLIDRRGKYLNQNYYYFPQGVKYLYDRLVIEAIGKPEFELLFDSEFEGLKYQIYLGYRTDWFPQPQIVSFANDNHTICNGALIDGIMDGLKSGCKKFVKDNNLMDHKIKKKKFINGLILIASVRGEEFEYEGSFKEKLVSDKVQNDSKKLIKKMTLEFIKNNRVKADKFLFRFDKTHLLDGVF